MDGTVNCKFHNDGDKAQKVVSLVIGPSEYQQYVEAPPLEIRRRFRKRVKVAYNGKFIFDKAFVYVNIEGNLIITFKPYKDSPKYVKKLSELLGSGGVYERINIIAQNNLSLGGEARRSPGVAKEFSQEEIKAIVTHVSSIKPFRLLSVAA